MDVPHNLKKRFNKVVCFFSLPSIYPRVERLGYCATWVAHVLALADILRCLTLNSIEPGYFSLLAKTFNCSIKTLTQPSHERARELEKSSSSSSSLRFWQATITVTLAASKISLDIKRLPSHGSNQNQQRLFSASNITFIILCS